MYRVWIDLNGLKKGIYFLVCGGVIVIISRKEIQFVSCKFVVLIGIKQIGFFCDDIKVYIIDVEGFDIIYCDDYELNGGIMFQKLIFS